MATVPDNLRSRQFAKIIDLISEGPIRGVVNGMKGVYLDGTPLQNAGGTLAYKNVSVQFVNGYPAQPIMKGFASNEAEEGVGLRLFYNNPITRTILNTDADRCRITVSVPALSNTNTKTGDIDGNSVSYRIQCAPLGKAYQLIGNYTISGKTMSRYQRAHTFKLPGVGQWQIRVTRTTADNTHTDWQNDLYFDSFTTIIDDRVNFTRSACVGVQIDAQQFSQIPRRSYLTDGLLVSIPKNYDPYKATYSGTWNGVFKVDWTNNPAWVFYDLVVNNRYGLGSFIPPSMVDKWALYKIAQFCDQRVKNGKGGTERRFTCNVQITSQVEAFDLLAQIASIFRGFVYWAGGQLVAVADDPSDPVMQYTNANVLDGAFNYQGADIRGRHSLASTAWADPKLLGEVRYAVVENRKQISRFGIQKIDDPGIGSTSEGQSIRTGKWALYTEEYETETISFSTGLESAWVRPGDIFQVSDGNIAGQRMGGRIVRQLPTDAHYIVVDQRPPMVDGREYRLSCIVPSASDPNAMTVQTRVAFRDTANASQIYISQAFGAVPAADSAFVLSDPTGLVPTLWRTLSVKQTEVDQYEISAVRHFPDKWNYVEKDMALAEPDITNITKKPPPVRSLAVREYMQQTSPVSLAIRAVLSWQSSAPQFDVYWRKAPANFSVQRTDAQAIDLPVTQGDYEFRVVPISLLGVRGDVAVINATIIGTSAVPAAPKQFRVNVIEGVALFDWLPADELDVIIGGHFELRFSPVTTGGTWNTAQIVVPSIPGSSTSVEANYQVGTWMLRTFDIDGRPSNEWATVIALAADTRYEQFERKCESPDWIGTHNGTAIQMPQEWLTIGVSGGLWDDQLNNVSTWADIDTLPIPAGTAPPPRQGSYKFFNSIDAGAPFSVRLAAEILAFPFYEGGVGSVDLRAGLVDTWDNWDDAGGDLGGSVTINSRSTLDDPLSPGAVWTAWKRFISGEHYARAWQFEAVLDAPNGQNIGIETLCITGDFRNKIDSGNDIDYPAARTRVDFRIKFFKVPAVVITVRNAASTDNVTIVNKTTEYFEIDIKDNSSVHQTRTFDWHAQGF